LTKSQGFCFLTLLLLAIVNATTFNQAAAAKAPVWMKEGAYLKYKFSDASFHTIEVMYVEVEKVHEHTADIQITVSHSENGPHNVYYGYLDLEAGGFTPLSGDRYPFYEEFWINPQSVNKPATSGLPPDNKDFSQLDCWILDSSEASAGVVRRWYDKVTGILIEVSLLVGGSATLTGVLYETDIPVGNQLVTSVETYPVFLIAAFVAMIAGTVALVVFLLRWVKPGREQHVSATERKREKFRGCALLSSRQSYPVYERIQIQPDAHEIWFQLYYVEAYKRFSLLELIQEFLVSVANKLHQKSEELVESSKAFLHFF
jgi:uncharacterized membrane protein YdcZ (DUF606 family)